MKTTNFKTLNFLKKIKAILLLLVFCCSIHFVSYATNTISNEKKEITIEFKTTKENLFKEDNGKVLAFKLRANFTDAELKEWIKSIKSDSSVKSVSVENGNIENGWDVKVVLKEPINRSVAKTLFSFSLKTDYVVVGEERFLFNVFISQYVPN
ncbi:MAG: hypothetical protein CVT98_00250 [Bacteroidetes bacterium HGW-Bacteroidetes-15]|nr:MAG: hypothetical protein CVT98_00250 [Bacteroidetes bacterium HGW-Bacteroidetes-15]